MRDVHQAYVSPTLNHFKDRLFKRWRFTEYSDPTLPTFFFGLYSEHDLAVLKDHTSKCLLYFGGNDFREKQIIAVRSMSNVICIGYGGDWLYDGCLEHGLPFTRDKLLIMDFDSFKPVKLGNKVYVYKGLNGNREDYFEWNTVVKPIMKIIGEERFIFADGLTLSELHESVYKESFVYLKPNSRGGSTAMFELGHMGIRTITNGHSGFPNTLSYSSIDDIIDLIKLEESRIGTIQHQVAADLQNSIIQSDSWLDTKSYSWPV